MRRGISVVSGAVARARDGAVPPASEPRPLQPPLLERLGARHWLVIDCVVAVALAIAYQAGVNEWAVTNTGPYWGWHVVAAAVPLPIAVRRLWPAPVLGLVLAGSVVLLLNGMLSDPMVGVALALYMAAARLPRSSAMIALGVVLLVLAALGAGLGLDKRRPATSVAGHVSSTVLVVTAAWSIGFTLRQRRVYTAGLQEQAERRGRAQVAEERLRIARELHDVVAHSMSLIAVQAGVANYVIDQRPEEAARALLSIEGTSRAALADMRRLLGVLRDVDGARSDPELEPAPDLTDLGTLAELTTHAGVRVELEVRGRPRDLPPGVRLAAYRIVQEALTNVMKHADTDASRVVVDHADDALCLEITDRGRGRAANGAQRPAEGHGITGMRERVGLYGGVFEAGPLPGGGFRVTARLPVGDETR